MRQQPASPDLAAAQIAARQHGVVSFHQLLFVGLSASAIARRLRTGRLHTIHRGVYAVGHAGLDHTGKCMAAALAYGEGAVVSHRSAAGLWGLLPPRERVVHITVPGHGGRNNRTGTRLHRSRSLTPEQTTRHMGIPITKPGRTLADLKRVVPTAELRRAIRQAGALGLSIGESTASDPTRSDLERAFLRLCRRYGLPMPAVNVRIDLESRPGLPRSGGASLEVDFLWKDRRLIVETDGYRYHRGKAAFEDDRERDLTLRTLGYEVIRLTYGQVTEGPERIAKTLKRALK